MQNTIIKNIKFPEGLPVSQRVEDIKKAITNNLAKHSFVIEVVDVYSK